MTGENKRTACVVGICGLCWLVLVLWAVLGARQEGKRLPYRNTGAKVTRVVRVMKHTMVIPGKGNPGNA